MKLVKLIFGGTTTYNDIEPIDQLRCILNKKFKFITQEAGPSKAHTNCFFRYFTLFLIGLQSVQPSLSWAAKDIATGSISNSESTSAPIHPLAELIQRVVAQLDISEQKDRLIELRDTLETSDGADPLERESQMRDLMEIVFQVIRKDPSLSASFSSLILHSLPVTKDTRLPISTTSYQQFDPAPTTPSPSICSRLSQSASRIALGCITTACLAGSLREELPLRWHFWDNP